MPITFSYIKQGSVILYISAKTIRIANNETMDTNQLDIRLSQLIQ